MLVDHRVVVEVHGYGSAVLPCHIVGRGVLPPRVEHPVVVGAYERVVQPQTEAGAA